MSAQEEQPVDVIDLEDQEEKEKVEPNEVENYIKPRKPVEDDRYYLERVVDKKVENSELMYFVKWHGYDESQNTWETMDNLDSSQEALIKFEDKLASSSKKGGKTFPVAREHIDDEKCRLEKARVLRECEIIEIMSFFPDTCRFVVKFDDNSCYALEPAEYAALPLKTKAMFAEFLAKTHGLCIDKIMKHYKKKEEIIQRGLEKRAEAEANKKKEIIQREQEKKKAETEANKKKDQKQRAEGASSQTAARREVDDSLSRKLKDAMAIYDFKVDD